MINTVLFDLDGTLVDTAPDMAEALNILLKEQGEQPLPYQTIRPEVSNGSVALVKLGFGIELDKERLEYLKQRYLDIYLQNLHVDSVLFEGMQEILLAIESSGKHWGVVTNKPSWLTEPLLRSMGLAERSGCMVSGDTTKERKPHPEPMFHACRLIGVNPENCLYIGDAQRDIEAGKSAGMKTIVANYGYIGDGENPASWGADAFIEKPSDILQHL